MEEPSYGYRRAWALLRREGEGINHKRVERLWRREGLQVGRRKKKRKRLRKKGAAPLEACHPGHVWTYDFVHDATEEGRKLKLLTVTDEFTRRSVGIHVDRRLPSRGVIEVLGRLMQEQGCPRFLRSDNGPEFIARRVKEWLALRGVRTHYIDPASPWQNAYGESFHDKLRQECLNREVFTTPAQARVIVEQWRRHYNERRPHSSLGYLTPNEFERRWKKEGKENKEREDEIGGAAPEPPAFIALEVTR